MQLFSSGLTFSLIMAMTTSSNDVVESHVQLNKQIQQIRDANHVPALAVLLVQDDEIQDSAAVGIRKYGKPTPITTTDKFHLGSDTKAMTATLVAMFVDEGKLSWMSTLGELLPEITSMNEAYKGVTIEMLLAHRSGLTGDLINFKGGSLWRKLQSSKLSPVDGRKLLAQEMLSQMPASWPSSKFEYSNAGYTVLGRILEKLSGESWEKLIEQRLFTPLHMRSCGLGAPGRPHAKSPDQPWAHLQTTRGIQAVLTDNPETIGPAGTVHCSMQDWSKFVNLHLQAFNGKPRLLKAESFVKLHTNYPGQDYTYGAWIRTERPWANGPAFTHDGSNNFNYASVWWAPKMNLIMIAVSNIGAPSGQKAAQEAIVPLLNLAKGNLYGNQRR